MIALISPCRAAARDDTAVAILLSKHQRAKIGEGSPARPGYCTKLKTDKCAVEARNTASSEAVALVHFQTQWGAPEEEARWP
jgi:hypothetical protein